MNRRIARARCAPAGLMWLGRIVAPALAMVLLAASASPVLAQCQLAKLTDPAGAPVDRLAFSVALLGDSLALSVPFRDDPFENSGAVFIFDGAPTDWNRRAALVLPEPGPYEGLGRALAAANGRVFAGSVIRRSVFVFEVASNEWQYLGSLIPEGPPINDGYPSSSAASGDRLVVGASWDNAGAAYVFERGADGLWSQIASLLAADGTFGDEFGTAVAIDGDVIVVGAPADDPFGFASGSAYLFERQPDGAWIQTAKLLPLDNGQLDHFGYSVAVQDGTVFVGATYAPDGNVSPGAVYVYEVDAGNTWMQIQKVTPPAGQNADEFGSAVAIEGGLGLVGAQSYHANGLPGAAFVYQRQVDRRWRRVGSLMAQDPQYLSQFGRSVALHGNVAIVGAPHYDAIDAEGNLVEDAGAAYVFAVGPDDDGDGAMDVCECRAAGDLDLSGAIEIGDLLILLSSFGLDVGGDLDGDGSTGLQDLAALLSGFGTNCP